MQKNNQLINSLILKLNKKTIITKLKYEEKTAVLHRCVEYAETLPSAKLKYDLI